MSAAATAVRRRTMPTGPAARDNAAAFARPPSDWLAGRAAAAAGQSAFGSAVTSQRDSQSAFSARTTSSFDTDSMNGALVFATYRRSQESIKEDMDQADQFEENNNSVVCSFADGGGGGASVKDEIKEEGDIFLEPTQIIKYEGGESRCAAVDDDAPASPLYEYLLPNENLHHRPGKSIKREVKREAYDEEDAEEDDEDYEDGDESAADQDDGEEDDDADDYVKAEASSVASVAGRDDDDGGRDDDDGGRIDDEDEEEEEELEPFSPMFPPDFLKAERGGDSEQADDEGETEDEFGFDQQRGDPASPTFDEPNIKCAVCRKPCADLLALQGHYNRKHGNKAVKMKVDGDDADDADEAEPESGVAFEANDANAGDFSEVPFSPGREDDDGSVISGVHPFPEEDDSDACGGDPRARPAAPVPAAAAAQRGEAYAATAARRSASPPAADPPPPQPRRARRRNGLKRKLFETDGEPAMDEDETFGRFVIAQLAKLSARRKRKLQMTLMNSIHSAVEEEEDEAAASEVLVEALATAEANSRGQ